MTEISFTACAVALYVGMVILAVDPWIEPGLRKMPPLWRAIPTVFFVIPLFAFTRYVVFLPSPLIVTATDYNGDYPAGRKIAGIEWKSAYSALHVLFLNQTDYDYKDLDFVVATNEYIAAAEQDGNVPGVSVFNTSGGPDRVSSSHKDSSGHITYEDEKNLQLLSGGIRVICDKLPRHSSFDIVLAIVNVPSAGRLSLPPSSDYLLALQGPTLVNREDVYGPRTPATKVGVSGRFKSLGQRPHRLREMHDVKQQ